MTVFSASPSATPSSAPVSAPSPTALRLEPAGVLEGALPDGDKTEVRAVAAFVPDRDGTWTVEAHSDLFDIRVEVRRAGAAGESLGKADYGGLATDAALTFDARAGEELLVIVRGDESISCGAGFTLKATPGKPDRPPADEQIRRAQRYWVEQAEAARSRHDDRCEVRALFEQFRGLRIDGQFDAARQAIDAAIDEAKGRLGERDPLYAWCLDGRGRMLREQGEDEAALPLLERTLQIIEAHYGPDHLMTAQAARDLAGLLGNMERWEEEQALLHRTLSIVEARLPPDDQEIAFALNDLAVHELDTGDLAEARRLMEQATSITEAQHPQDAEDLAAGLSNLGFTARRLGDYDAARRDYERALALLAPIADATRRAVARTTGNLASVSLEQGDVPQARRLYEEALRLTEGLYGPDHLTTAVRRLPVARLDAWDRNFDAARAAATGALAVIEKRGGPDKPETANALARLAQIERDSGAPDRALPLLDRATAILEARLGPSHPDLASLQRSRAAVLLDLGRPAESLAAAALAEEIGREHLRLMARALPESQGLRYAATRPRGLDLALRIAATTASGVTGAGPGGAAPRPESTGSEPGAAVPVRRSWDLLMRSRAIVLDELARRRQSLATGTPETQRLRDDLARAGARLARLLVRAAESDAPADIARRLDDARHARDRAEQALLAVSGRDRAGSAAAGAGFEEIVRALAPAQALVAYVRVNMKAGLPHVAGTSSYEAPPEMEYLAFVQPGPGRAPALVRLGSAGVIERAIGRWREAILARPQGLRSAPADRERESRAAGASLRALVWDPAAAALDPGTGTVFVVPDGALHLVGFAALPSSGNQYLVETAPLLTMLSSERDLLAGAGEERGLARALVVGGPDFESGVTPGRGGPVAGCRGALARPFPALPAARGEAADVASILKRGGRAQVDTLTGSGASEQAFKRLAPGARWLHLATHGFAAEDSCSAKGTAEPDAIADAGVHGAANPLALAGLALAGANRRAGDGAGLRDAAEDGILTAEEIASLDLTSARRVVLSACDTGLGAISEGEGLLGLQRAFLIAGARELVLSLWRVPDDSTREWMSLVYGELARHPSASAALRNAARTWLREERRAGGATDPLVWGAFVASGAPRPERPPQ
jgi:CHAT domain-containing protein/Tfp pilus assembly protein PilF